MRLYPLNPRSRLLNGNQPAILLCFLAAVSPFLGAAPSSPEAMQRQRAEVEISVPLSGARLSELARDGSGQVWGVLWPPGQGSSAPDYGLKNSTLASFDPIAGAWKVHLPVPPLTKPRARTLFPLCDGRMACLREGEDDLLLTRTSPGGSEELWCGFGQEMEDLSFFPLRQGGVVITGLVPFFLHLRKESSTAVEVSLPAELWRPSAAEDAQAPDWANVSALECADGSLVFWHNSLRAEPNIRQLKGLIRWLPEEGRFEAHQPFGARAGISALIADGPDHLLAAVPEQGLFRISLADFSATRMPEPRIGGQRPFDHIEKLAWAGSRLYVVTCPPPAITGMAVTGSAGFISTSRTTFHPLKERAGTLWGWDWRQAAFQPLIQGLDREPPFGWSDRPMVATGKGLLVGSAGERPWWLPRGQTAQPFQLPEDHDFRLRAATQLEPLPDGGGFLARDAAGYAATRPLPGIAPEGWASSLRLVLTDGPPVRDRGGHLWAFGVRTDTGTGTMAFGEWDGQRWRSQALPLDVRDCQHGNPSFETDGSDQAWLLPDDGGRTAVFDFISADWEVFDSLTAAVQARLLPGHKVNGGKRRLLAGPVAAPDGSKGFFLSLTNQAQVLIKGKWHLTEWDKITAGEITRMEGPPYFGENGAFRLPIGDGSVYQTLDGTTWTPELIQPEEDDLHAGGFSGEPSPPQRGWGIDGVQSATEDADGVVWLATSEGRLWKYLAGRTVPVMDHGHPLLLPEGTSILQVLRDPLGNTFLGDNGGDYSFRNLILPPARQPGFLPALETASGEKGRTLVRTGAPPGAWLRWKLDEAAWSDLAQFTDGMMKLPILPPGPHVVEVAAFDGELSPLGKTRTLTVEVAPLDEAALLALVEQLRTGSPDEREAAARILRVQEPAALPVLQKIADDPTTGKTLRWWLRAAIQGIQHRSFPRRGGGR